MFARNIEDRLRQSLINSFSGNRELNWIPKNGLGESGESGESDEEEDAS